MKFKEILYDKLEGNKLSENGRRLLHLKQIGFSGTEEIYENGSYMLLRDKETKEVTNVSEKIDEASNSENNDYYRQKTVCECPSKGNGKDLNGKRRY